MHRWQHWSRFLALHWTNGTSETIVLSDKDWLSIITWLVVSTPLKNISQLGWLFPVYGKIKNVPNHQPDNLCYRDVIQTRANTHTHHCSLLHTVARRFSGVHTTVLFRFSPNTADAHDWFAKFRLLIYPFCMINPLFALFVHHFS